MSNPSSASDVAFLDSKGGNGVFVPRNSFEALTDGGEKTRKPTPNPATNRTIATTATITIDTPFAPRIASTGGATPPSAISGANACQYLNLTGRQDSNGVRTPRNPNRYLAARRRHSSSTSRPASRISFVMFSAGIYRMLDSPQG